MGEKKISDVADRLGIRQKLRHYPFFQRPWYLYFLTECDEVVYVGQTRNLQNRLKCHVKEKAFDDVFYIELDSFVDILALESAVIKTVRPRLNATKITDHFHLKEIIELEDCRHIDAPRPGLLTWGRVLFVSGPWEGRYGCYDDDETSFEEDDGFKEGDSAAIVYLEGEGGEYVLADYEELVNVPEPL